MIEVAFLFSKIIFFLIIFLQVRFYPDVEFYDEKKSEKTLLPNSRKFNKKCPAWSISTIYFTFLYDIYVLDPWPANFYSTVQGDTSFPRARVYGRSLLVHTNVNMYFDILERREMEFNLFYVTTNNGKGKRNI